MNVRFGLFLAVLMTLTVTFGLGDDSMVDSPSKGVRCSNKPCTYYDEKNNPFSGHCGSKKGDVENCYCYKDEDNDEDKNEDKNDQKKPSQTESKEDIRPCQMQPACGQKQPGN